MMRVLRAIWRFLDWYAGELEKCYPPHDHSDPEHGCLACDLHMLREWQRWGLL